ncbi:hypothetical protein P7K49_040197 [Saguinus oedipus]|uniref:Uncharacterized protein n=1 Tax=Saguinus oedipus TaxID=9490 RepID=A0ABQ9TA62_SAGOE|nr:hypothetical protein P7K49_040197 [Saguinus oedipus]
MTGTGAEAEALPGTAEREQPPHHYCERPHSGRGRGLAGMAGAGVGQQKGSRHPTVSMKATFGQRQEPCQGWLRGQVAELEQTFHRFYERPRSGGGRGLTGTAQGSGSREGADTPVSVDAAAMHVCLGVGAAWSSGVPFRVKDVLLLTHEPVITGARTPASGCHGSQWAQNRVMFHTQS